MKITSRITFFLPFLLLTSVSNSILNSLMSIINYHYKIYDNDSSLLGLLPNLFILCISFSMVFFFYRAFQFLESKPELRNLKYLIFAVPFLLNILIFSILGVELLSSFMIPMYHIAILYWAYYLLDKRFEAYLTDTAIQYNNLLGQIGGQIPLTEVTKLEQKRNYLSVIKEFKVLNIAQKTGITFKGENDEVEIDIFAKVWKGDFIFDKIIENAKNCGNQKIRQYMS
jgi:hypothetical protein